MILLCLIVLHIRLSLAFLLFFDHISLVCYLFHCLLHLKLLYLTLILGIESVLEWLVFKYYFLHYNYIVLLTLIGIIYTLSVPFYPSLHSNIHHSALIFYPLQISDNYINKWVNKNILSYYIFSKTISLTAFCSAISFNGKWWANLLVITLVKLLHDLLGGVMLFCTSF